MLSSELIKLKGWWERGGIEWIRPLLRWTTRRAGLGIHFVELFVSAGMRSTVSADVSFSYRVSRSPQRADDCQPLIVRIRDWLHFYSRAAPEQYHNKLCWELFRLPGLDCYVLKRLYKQQLETIWTKPVGHDLRDGAAENRARPSACTVASWPRPPESLKKTCAGKVRWISRMMTVLALHSF